MKLVEPKNKNYCATVFKIKSITPLEGCDNVVGTPIFGFQAIVGKDVNVGDIGIVFPAEVQLSEEFCRVNNLHRHGNLNADEGKKGYLEDSRRIKAIKFRGHRSDSLFMPLECLKYTGVDIKEFKEGEEFDELKGREICKKYQVKIPVERGARPKQPKQFNRVDTKFIPEHYDSDNYFKNVDRISPDTEVIVTQKLHGTSIRIGNTIVKRKLNVLENVLKLLRVKVQEVEYDYVYGSRKVIKDINNPYHNHFYSTDIWTEEGKKLEGMLPKNCILYGELIGWVGDGSPIQKNYTYNLAPGTRQIYIYRVAFVTEEGRVIELSWNHVKQFCKDLGLFHVPELMKSKVSELQVEELLNVRFNDRGFMGAVPLGDNKDIVDEGVCIRIDTMIPYILKAKSPIFLQHESKILDTGTVDLETQGSSDTGEEI